MHYSLKDNEPSETNIIHLTHETWQKILYAAYIRKQTKNFYSSVYRDVVENLPNDMHVNGGYHYRRKEVM